ncbi:MAG: secretion system protein [Demequinaceae bacterium]|nr:secretion system protein [Demequinaceae bacterium]
MRSGTSLVTLCALLAAAVRSGVDVRSALEQVARVADGDAKALGEVANGLAAGVPWGEAWTLAPSRLWPLGRALGPAWERGSSPVDALDALADATLARARAAGGAAAAELGVRLSLPLALCLLPAFILVGIVPLLIAVGGSVVGDVAGGGP